MRDRGDLRPATASEAAQLTELAVRSKAHWGYEPEVMRVFERELRVDPALLERGRGYVVECDDRIVGFYTLSDCNEHEVYLEHLFVDPECLRLGLGRRLLEHAEKTAAGLGYRRIVVWADPYAENFYLRCGGVAAGSVASSIPGRSLPVLHIELDGGD